MKQSINHTDSILFHNPNSSEKTARFLAKLIARAVWEETHQNRTSLPLPLSVQREDSQ